MIRKYSEGIVCHCHAELVEASPVEEYDEVR
jgi:hypothetical protein